MSPQPDCAGCVLEWNRCTCSPLFGARASTSFSLAILIFVILVITPILYMLYMGMDRTIYLTRGPAPLMVGEVSTNCAKFARNSRANSRARASCAAGSGQVARGSRIPEGTSGQTVRTESPKTGSKFLGAPSSPPSRTARSIARAGQANPLPRSSRAPPPAGVHQPA